MKVGRRKKSTKFFTLNEIICWFHHKLGIKSTQTRTKLRISETTYYRYVNEIEEAIQKHIQVNELQRICLLLYPLAIKSLTKLLQKAHPLTTVKFLEGFGILKQHVKGEGFGDTYNFFNEGEVDSLVDKILSDGQEKNSRIGSKRL